MNSSPSIVAAIGERHRLRRGRSTPSRSHIDDLALDPLHAVALRQRGAGSGRTAGIEMECVDQLRQRQTRIGPGAREPAERCGDRRSSTIRGCPAAAGASLREVELVEMDAAMSCPCGPNGWKYRSPMRAPVDELDAELERALAGGEEFVLVDPDHVVERMQRRDRRFADADGADLVRFDQDDLDRVLVEQLEKAAAAIHPAVPPPTITILRMA